MRPVLNQQTLLWIVGVLQPASANEVKCYIDIAFEIAGHLPSTDKIQKFCMSQEKIGRLIRVERDPDLFSLTSKGDDFLFKKHRHARDKARLYLLKDARKGKLKTSRESDATGLGGVAPSLDERPTIKGSEANKLGLVVPRGQAYWPRFSKQLIDETGLQQPSRDNSFLQFLSFSSVKQLALARNVSVDSLQLDFTSIGLMLGISPRLIVQIIRNPARHYRSFQLSKKGGGQRTIDSPRTFLKVIQQFLTDYYLSGLPVHQNVESYRQGHSIVSNAKRHCQRAFVANIDIKDYFGSINRSHVVGILKSVGYEEFSAEIVSRLCTKDDVLPQGAPTSPALSNTFLFDFDKAISDQCSKKSLSYSRYADDISISGDEKPPILEMIELSREMLVEEYGLRLNDTKTRIASHHGQQKVTGVVVNEEPRPPREFRRKVRAAFYNAEKREDISIDLTKKLMGYLSYLMSFEQLRDTEELRKYKAIIIRLQARYRPEL